jgi:hypothetical protein
MARASSEPRDEPRDVAADAGAVLSRSTLMTLRRVLHAYREGWLLEERLAWAARMAAEDARLGGVTAERMLVALKREWAALDDVRNLAALDARALLSRLVTLSIRAYYTRGRSASRSGRLTEQAGHGDARSAA